MLSSSGCGGSWCSSFSVSRTQPMSTEMHALGVVGADDELGRAAADVDDEERPVRLVDVGGRAEERQLTLLRARQQLGPRADDLLGRRRRTRRGCRHRVPRMSPRCALVRHRGRPSRRGTRAARSGFVRSLRERARPRGIDALTEPRDAHAAIDRRELSVARSARRRAGGSSSCRSRSMPGARSCHRGDSARGRRSVARRPTARRGRRRRRGTRRSARAGT